MSSLVHKVWLLTGRLAPSPTLDLNMLTGSLPAGITFTRAAGPATYLDNAGVLRTAGTNVARFEYNPASTNLRGLMIEETRTNILTNSQAINSWPTKTDTTVTDNSIASPDSTTNASLCTEGVAGTAQVVSNIPTVAAGSALSFTMFLKRGNTDFLRVLCVDTAAANGAQFWVNLATGVISGEANRGTATARLVVITALANGWFRITCQITMPGTSTTAELLINSASAANSTTRVNGATYYLWGGQIEVGNQPTSYIPTTAAAATRPADVATVAQPMPIAATLVIDALTLLAQSKVATLLAFIGASGKTGLTLNASNQVIAFDTAGAIAVNIGNEPIQTVFKAAVSINTGGVRYGCLDTVATIGAAAALTAGNTLIGIGYDGTSQQPCNYIRRVRFWPQALTAPQLQQVTQ